MYVVFIPWPPIKWVLFTVYILVPIFSAVGYCYFMNRSSFHFDSQNMVSKVSVYRLIVRLLSVLCFLLIGYYVNTNRVLQMFIFDSLSRFGEHGDNFASILCNFSFYLIVAIFPTVFALVEYLFVKERE